MRCLRKFIHKKIPEGIHQSAIVKSDLIGKNTSIGPYSYVENNASIGENCIIYGGVQIFNGTKIGNNVTIYPSVIIGDASFGPQRNESYVLETCQHLGGVNIGNCVEIGSHTSILSGFLEDTIIDDGTKISSQVYIGSGMKIGKNCMITGNAYFGGSSVLEDNVYVGPGANIRNGIKISKNSFVGMGSVVVKDVPENTTVIGVPAKQVEHNSDTNAIDNIK
jgi:UDP-3-O-[3-hydroxymyristoyl] glucosamine N-acyltransferase